MKATRAAPVMVAMFLACSTRQPAPVVERPAIIPHDQWHARPPLGHAADATRRNIAASGSLAFRDLTIDVLSTAVDSASGQPRDVVSLRLTQAGTTEERTAREGTAFNWRGFHVAIVAIY